MVKGRRNVGAIAGQPYSAKLTNISLTGLVKVEGKFYVGGMFGHNGYADATNLTVNVEPGSYVSANSVENGTGYRTYVGGVIGFRGDGEFTYSNVVSNIDVIGNVIDVGGISGFAHYGNKFVNCSSSGNVILNYHGKYEDDKNVDMKAIGGIAGQWYNQDNTTVTFTNCSFTGTLTSKDINGVEFTEFENNGLVGAAYSTTGTGQLIIN